MENNLGQACRFLTIGFNVETELSGLGEKDNDVLEIGVFQPLLPSISDTFSVVHTGHRHC